MKDPIKQFIDSLPLSSQNNSREIIRNAYKKSEMERYGGYWTRQIEEFTGEPSDRSGYDCGMEMEHKNIDY